MSFSARIAAANAATLARFANCDVTVMSAAVAVRTFRGILDLESQVVSPFDANQLLTKPALSALSSDLDGFAGGMSLVIQRDGDSTAREYVMDGKPRPDGAGITLLYLTVKK